MKWLKRLISKDIKSEVVSNDTKKPFKKYNNGGYMWVDPQEAWAQNWEEIKQIIKPEYEKKK